MAGGRVLLLLFCITHAISGKDYEIPKVTIEAFKPKGFRASIPGRDGSSSYDDFTIAHFRFDATIIRANSDKPSNEKISGLAISPTREGAFSNPLYGPWIIVDENVTLHAGDQLDYEVSVTTIQSPQYHNKKGKYVITELIEGGVKQPPPPWEGLFNLPEPSYSPPTEEEEETLPEENVTQKPSKDCRPTVTKVRNAVACAGAVIFEDNFDRLDEDRWQIEHYMPTKQPDHPFVSYQKLMDTPTVSVRKGKLRIEPRFLDTLPGFSNDSLNFMALDLYNGCTKSEEECFMQASGASILPPIVSGRITSRFAFTYGIVHIRAKLPQGDWLYPEIFLEPFLKRYGSLNYASGLLKIVSSLGNKQLSTSEGLELGNSVIEGGAILGMECRKSLVFTKNHPRFQQLWGDAFHKYSLKWTPDSIVLLIDGAEWARIDLGDDRLQNKLPSRCRNSNRQLVSGTNMAPFDTHFYLTLGLAAGGVTEFPDSTTSDGSAKPWRNSARKAVLNFWQSRDVWQTSWQQSRLIVDYVKVEAL